MSDSSGGDETAPVPARARREPKFSRTGLVAFGILGAVFLWYAGELLLLIFAGVLLAIFLRTGAALVSRVTRLSMGWSVAVVVLLLLGGATVAGWLFVPALAEQARELTEAVPRAVSQLSDRMRQTTWGGWILEKAAEQGPAQQEGEVAERATQAAFRLLDALVAFAIVLFVGLYLAADPLPYVRGLLRLFPLGRRRRAGEVLFAAGYQMRWWLIGQLLSMLVVGFLMGTGLAIIGVPLAFALGFLAALLEFIPTIGPPLAVIPAVLLAVVEDPQKGLYVLVLYGVVQTVESYLLMPLVQQRAVHLRPVVTITGQVFFAWTAGAIGLLVAVPLIAVLQTAIQMWYVQDFLGDRMPVPGGKEGIEELDEAGVV